MPVVGSVRRRSRDTELEALFVADCVFDEVRHRRSIDPGIVARVAQLMGKTAGPCGEAQCAEPRSMIGAIRASGGPPVGPDPRREGVTPLSPELREDPSGDAAEGERGGTADGRAQSPRLGHLRARPVPRDVRGRRPPEALPPGRADHQADPRARASPRASPRARARVS